MPGFFLTKKRNRDNISLMSSKEIDEAMRPYIEKEKSEQKQESEDKKDKPEVKPIEGEGDGLVEINGVRKFRLGEYIFDNFHEYRDGMEDLEKIRIIEDKIDMNDPKMVLRLYNTIRDGQIVFKTKIGEDFFSHLGDKVADKSVGLLKDKEVVDTAEGQVKYQRYLGMAIITVAAVLFAYFGFRQFDDYLNTRRIQQAQKQTEQDARESSASGGRASADKAADLKGKDPFKRTKTVNEKDLKVLSEYRSLKKEHPDMVGWLRIDDTDINYPVMQKEKDNSYYLSHAFDGTNSTAGALFMDYRSDSVNPTTNTIIYGHNMKNGTMFGSLKKYLSENYFNKHRTIKFDTVYEHREYEIVAVCLAKVQTSDEDTFRYYNFIQANNENEWDAFVESVGGMVVNGGMDVKAGDELLTLSTCNNYVEDGRLFIVAKQINE